MLTLLIDTCTERGLVAIFDGTFPLFVDELPVGLQNSSVLLPTLEAKLKELGLRTADLQLIAVAAGPGSYTGIRVGVAAARGIAFVHQLPVVGVSTLHGLIPQRDGVFMALIDAKIGGAYYLQGTRSGLGVEYVLEPAVASLEELASKISSNSIVVTPIARILQEKLFKIAPTKEWEWLERAPDAAQMIQVAQERYRRGLFSPDGHIEILYLRKTQAELDKEN